jgi:hypothetical protein
VVETDASEDERGDSNVFFHLCYEIFAILLIGVRADLLGFVQEGTKCLEHDVFLGEAGRSSTDQGVSPHSLEPYVLLLCSQQPSFRLGLPRSTSAQSTDPQPLSLRIYYFPPIYADFFQITYFHHFFLPEHCMYRVIPVTLPTWSVVCIYYKLLISP